jgi:hypothetical protein
MEWWQEELERRGSALFKGVVRVRTKLSHEVDRIRGLQEDRSLEKANEMSERAVEEGA